MGNDSLKPLIAHSSNWEYVQQIEHALYGQIRVYRNGNTLQCLRTFTEQQTEELIQKIKQIQLYELPYLVKILKLEEQEQDQFCSTYKKVYLTMEYAEHSIAHLPLDRLPDFVTSVTQALLFQDYRKIDTCQLCPSKVLEFENGWKLVEQQLLTQTTDYERLYLRDVHEHDWMIAPEVMAALRSNKQPQFNNQKATVFNLGMMLISLLTGTHPQNHGVYDYQQCKLTQHWATYVSQLDNLPISKYLRNLIESCLHENPDDRPSYKQILERVDQPEPTVIVPSPSPQKERTEYLVPPNQQISFNPSFEEAKRALAECDLNNNSPAPKESSPKFVEQRVSQLPQEKKPKQIYNLENIPRKRSTVTSSARPSKSNLRWKA